VIQRKLVWRARSSGREQSLCVVEDGLWFGRHGCCHNTVFATEKGSGNRFTLLTFFQNGNDWVSQAEAARIRGVSRQAISRLIKKGRLRVFQIGGKVLLDRAEIETFVPEKPGRPANERIIGSNQ